MLRSRWFAARPRSAELLRFFVEESIRSGCKPIGQRLIAAHGLGLGSAFSPTRSAEVRVKVARLRTAIERYYAGPGRGDPVVLSISPGPYRLGVSRAEASPDRLWPVAVRESRGTLPIVLMVEPRVDRAQVDDGLLAADVSLRLCGLLAESQMVNAGGPLPRGRITGVVGSAAGLAATLGYDYVAEAEILRAAVPWTVRIAITGTRLGEPATEFTSRFDPADAAAAAEAIATWMFHRISDCFTTLP